MRVALLFAAFLVAWGNVVSSLLGPTATLPGGSVAFAIAGVALTSASLVVARARGAGVRALFGSRREILVGAVIGAFGASLAAIVALAFLRFIAPAITGAPVEYGPLARVTSQQLAAHIALLLPLGVVLPEEIAFRGTLLAVALREIAQTPAVLLSAAAFALWHGAVIVATVSDTTLAPPSPWFAFACLAALAVVFAGGALFTLLRLRTRTIATTVMAHWLFNAVLLVGLWATH